MVVSYDYGKDGRLRSFQSRLLMIDQGSCERSYSVSPSGTLHQISKRITGGDVSWFQGVKHWMSLSELPLKPKA